MWINSTGLFFNLRRKSPVLMDARFQCDGLRKNERALFDSQTRTGRFLANCVRDASQQYASNAA